MKKVILNQKSYMFYEEMIKYKTAFDKIKPKNYEFIIYPQLIYLSMFKDSKYKVGAQNFFSYKAGSFTGEINLEVLKDMKINYTLIGHYERHKILFETYELSKEKLFKSLGSKCNTILCVGEVKKTKKPFNYIKKELNFYLRSIDSSNINYLSIAYEPSWAIGSGDIQEIEKINDVINKIKNYMKKRYKHDFEVYYGGSITKDTVSNIIKICDGIVLGKVSTKIDELKEILNNII